MSSGSVRIEDHGEGALATALRAVEPNGVEILSDISVVVPTLGRAILERCLSSLVAGDAWPASLILVDQGSNPSVARWVRRLRDRGWVVCHIVSERKGRASGVNLGLQGTDTRFAALTDDDCLVDSKWLRRMAEHLRRSPEAIVTGRVEGEGDERAVDVVTATEPVSYRRPGLWHDLLAGGNMGLATAVYVRLGPLDEDPCVACAEDCEYAYRALRRGIEIRYDPEIVVRHVAWRGEEQRAARYREYARSHAGFFGKYLRRGDWFVSLRALALALRAAKRWARGQARGDRDATESAKAYLGQLGPGLWAGWTRGRRP